MVYYLSPLGAFRTDGYAVQNLSFGRIEDSIIKDLMATTEGIDTPSQAAAYDSRFDVVMWPFATSTVKYVLRYHIGHDKFTIDTPSVTMITATVYSVRNGASEESQEEIPHVFSSTPKLMAFDDPAVAISLRTGFVELHPGRLTQITGLQFLGVGNPSNLVLQARAESDLASVTTELNGYTSADASNRSDIHRIRKTGRYHSFRVSAVAGSDDLFRGIRVNYEISSQT